MRHILAHGYDIIEYAVIWDTVQNNLPELGSVGKRWDGRLGRRLCFVTGGTPIPPAVFRQSLGALRGLGRYTGRKQAESAAFFVRRVFWSLAAIQKWVY